MNSDQLRAFVRAVDEGTFDAAALTLGVSASALSQRIKALEKEVGHVLLTRTVPVATTASGEQFLGIARQSVLLEDEARRLLGFHGSSPDSRAAITLSLAVNADSLASWFLPVLKAAAQWPEVELHLYAEDQQHTHELLRNGTVSAAVTENPETISGCRSEFLGTFTYWPVATHQLLERHRDEDDVVDWSQVPQIDYSSRDQTQRAALARLGVKSPAVTHLVPSVQAYSSAVAYGLGWGMIPEDMLPEGVREGTHDELSVIAEIGSASLNLYWQHWSTTTAAMERLSEAVREAATNIR